MSHNSQNGEEQNISCCDPALLRRKAEEILKERMPVPSKDNICADEVALVHELQVHQIELDMQNEELERARSEAEMLHEKFVDLYDFAPVGYFTIDRIGTILEVNLTGCLLLGQERQKVIGRRLQTFMLPGSIPAFNLFCRNVTGSGTKEICEVELFSDGDKRFFAHVEGTEMPEKREDSGKIRMTISDITLRREAEESLRESEERFHILFEQSPIPYQSLDADGRFLEVNSTWLDLLGYRRDEVIGHWFGDFLVPEHVSRFKRNFPEFKKNKITSDIEFLMKNKDGSIILTSFDGKVGLNPDGSFKQTHCVFRDITEKKQVEEALIESEKRYRALFEDSPVSLWEEDFSAVKLWIDSKNAEGITDLKAYFSRHPEDVRSCARMVRVNGINSTTKALIGLKSEEDCYKDLSATFSDGSYFTFKDEIILFAAGITHYQGIGVIKTLSGEEKDILIHCSVVPGYEKTWEKVLVSIVDLTDRVAMERSLRQANSKLNLLSSITRHDILNGVTVLLGYIDLASEKTTNPELKCYLNNLDEAAETIRHQIEFTKEYQEIGVNAAAWQNVSDVAVTAGSTFNRDHVILTTRCGDIEIFADPLLQKVFYNLFDNAFRYAAPFTEITVTCERRDGGLSVVFADDGAGISDEDKKKLFKRGFGKHTGLGLFLSREILAITGITITENGEPGKGARFEMTVPKGGYRFATKS
ncbi:PAS domain-containing sensor histidine kinase [Methanoplanus endosymbiosus]|uniref:histidine kinase n=1 Tax=Methanoplanus endosymbiosus TaxID=33865 RepID=A0A9E7TIT7_9EURY|nr:PAS domain S-box protein [Methanoplanus endosymbiosus]UUX92908.1 PAS domain S-box protein [Methanoplanus endosymbiosus]